MYTEQRPLGIDSRRIAQLCGENETPFYLYDAKGIRETVQAFTRSFDWVGGEGAAGGAGYQNYFAVKALPNPHILKLLHGMGSGVDCSSMAELLLAERCGIRGGDIFFTSNNTPLDEYRKAAELGACVNLDDIGHLDFIHDAGIRLEWISFRYNPGERRSGNSIIGVPVESKFGLTHEQIFTAYERAASLGIKGFGLHAMIASNELNPDYFVETARMLFELARDIHGRCGVRIGTINLGGGMGIPYQVDQSPLDVRRISSGIRELYRELISQNPELDPIRVVSENGRIITGPNGYLVSRVRHIKRAYRDMLGLDANMANLMRPGMYGAYHHITILGPDGVPRVADPQTYDVTGSLCENNDKFAIDRLLPRAEVGDIVVIHDAGAHGHAMGFNYNGKLRCAEFLLGEDGGEARKIRRAETYEDHFRTLV